jgi:8-oxo-dGTP pyrophosphatase MutT (NUDIX family)
MEGQLSSDYRGVSLLIQLRGRFLWAMGSREFWKKVGGRLYVDYEGVGGGLEPGETFVEAAHRECREETGCEVELLPSPRTFVLDDVEGTTSEAAGWEASPLMVWRKRLLGRKTLLVYTYFGRVRGTARPGAEVPALIYTSAKEVLRRATPTVQEVLDAGAELVEASRIPRDAAIRPWGTPVYLRRLIARRLFCPVPATT